MDQAVSNGSGTLLFLCGVPCRGFALLLPNSMGECVVPWCLRCHPFPPPPSTTPLGSNSLVCGATHPSNAANLLLMQIEVMGDLFVGMLNQTSLASLAPVCVEAQAMVRLRLLVLKDAAELEDIAYQQEDRDPCPPEPDEW
jgi:hypothetical protein